MRRSGVAKLLITVPIFILVGFVARGLYSSVFTPTCCSCIFSSAPSEETKSRISGFVDELFAEGRSIAAIVDEVKQAFSVVNSITAVCEAFGNVKLLFTLDEPVITTGNGLVVTKRGAVLDAGVFGYDAVESLKRVSVAGDRSVVDRDAGLLSRCSQELSHPDLDGWDLHWSGDRDIRCSNSGNKFFVLCSSDTVPCGTTLRKCEKLVDQVALDRRIRKRRGERLCFDVRFENKIIVCSEGGRHEKRSF